MFIDRRCFIPLAPSGATSARDQMSLLTELGSLVHPTTINIALLTERGTSAGVDANDARSWHPYQASLRLSGRCCQSPLQPRP